MVSKVKKALDAYVQSSVEVDVAQASPHKLICMLYDGAIKSVMLARVHLENGEVAQKGGAISKAISIVEEGLRVCLEVKDGGDELAANLDALYEYIGIRLLHANLKNDVTALDEVHRLLCQLREAWSAIEPVQGGSAVSVVAPSQRDSFSYGRI